MNEITFWQQALIYLAVAVIAVPISKRLGLGSVLGFLCAGIVIGPFGFKLISNVKTILSFSEFGVVLLLFLVGLELNVTRLWKLRRSILGMGTVQVLLTTIVVTAIGIAAKIPFAIALTIGMGFGMSSTAIALQTLKEKNLLSTATGQASFSVLLFQDLAVIPLMALLALLAPKTTAGHINWIAVIKGIGIIISFIILSRFLLRPILRYIAQTDLREIFVAFSLLLVLGTALLMESIGLSMALGTFLAGVLLADSEYRHQLELDIEPFKGLLLGLFFIAVGMSINLHLFVSHLLLVLGVAVGIVFLKIILLYFIARSFRESQPDSQIFALALSQIGEFAFVLFSVASGNGILAPKTHALLNAIVATSMLTTPLLIMLYEKLILPHMQLQKRIDSDVINEHSSVIIAGFGRVGSVIARLLHGKGIRTTIIDYDPNQIELVRRFGMKAYYGDISRLDLLHAAGAAEAKLIIFAIDNSTTTLQTIPLVKQNFPHLKILVRARGRSDAYEFIDIDMHPIRETFDSALLMGELALRELGYGAYPAHRAAQQFKKHDEMLLKKNAKYRHDQKTLISIGHQGRIDLENLLNNEETRLKRGHQEGWS